MSTPWFFLSYARVDRDKRLEEFHSDLVREVQRRAALGDLKPEQIGFLDLSSIKTGASWSKKIAAALQTCRVFVCLYSPSYFKSEYCGKELQAFLSRLREYQRANNLEDTSPLIFPVLWLSPGDLPAPLPDAVSWIQYTDSELGDGYATNGLVYLKETGRENEYRDFLIKFAQKIVREGKGDVLPQAAAPPSFDQIECPFPDARRSPVIPAQGGNGRPAVKETESGLMARLGKLASRPALAVPALIAVLAAALTLYWWIRPVVSKTPFDDQFIRTANGASGGNDWEKSAKWDFPKERWGLLPSAAPNTWLVVSGTTPGVEKDKLFDDFEADFTVNFNEGSKAGWVFRAQRNFLTSGYSGYYFTLSKPAKEGDPFILTATLRRGWLGETTVDSKSIYIAQYGQPGDLIWIEVRAVGGRFDYAVKLLNEQNPDDTRDALTACKAARIEDDTLTSGYVGLFAGSDADKIEFSYLKVTPITPSTLTKDFLCTDK
jgi:hypothetical protein